MEMPLKNALSWKVAKKQQKISLPGRDWHHFDLDLVANSVPVLLNRCTRCCGEHMRAEPSVLH